MKIFVGCSSKNEIPSKYKDDCTKLLEKLFIDNDLVFGAYDSGLMGISYHEALKNKKEVIGICPDAYKEDFKDLNCTKEIVTKNVSERIDNLISESDICLFLPGGIGTINELFLALESKRCHEFDKPIIIYNSCGFFDELLLFLEKIYNESFTMEYIKESYFVSSNVDELLDYISNLNDKKRIKLICNH